MTIVVFWSILVTNLCSSGSHDVSKTYCTTGLTQGRLTPIQLVRTDVSIAAKRIEPFLGAGQLFVDTDTNTVFIPADAKNLRIVSDILKRMDAPRGQIWIRLKHSDSSTAATAVKLIGGLVNLLERDFSTLEVEADLAMNRVHITASEVRLPLLESIVVWTDCLLNFVRDWRR